MLSQAAYEQAGAQREMSLTEQYLTARLINSSQSIHAHWNHLHLTDREMNCLMPEGAIRSSTLTCVTQANKFHQDTPILSPELK